MGLCKHLRIIAVHLILFFFDDRLKSIIFVICQREICIHKCYGLVQIVPTRAAAHDGLLLVELPVHLNEFGLLFFECKPALDLN